MFFGEVVVIADSTTFLDVLKGGIVGGPVGGAWFEFVEHEELDEVA